MALTTFSNGSGGGTNIAQASWWNQYHDLLTGTMTDQAVTLKKTGGGITLTVSCDASTVPFKVLQGDGSSLGFQVDHSGNLSGPAGGGLPITRNNVAGSTPVYTGTSSPSSPPTGAIWVKA